MKITINSEEFEFKGKTIEDLLNQKKIVNLKGIALAINENVIPKHDWKSYFLKPEDEVLIIKPVQGG